MERKLLVGDKVRLETVKLDKYYLTNQWFNDPMITRNLLVGILPMGKDTSKEFLERNQRPSDTERAFSIIALDLPESEENYIGHISLHKIDWINRSSEIGIVIGERKNLNKGYGTDAIKTLLNFAFMEMNLNRIYLTHKAFNERGHHAYLKAGFKEEGRMRNHIYRNGQYWDMVFMGILREEYLRDVN